MTGARRTPHVILAELDNRGQQLERLCDALTALQIGVQVTAPRPELAAGAQYDFVLVTTWLSSWLQEAWPNSLRFLLDHAGEAGVDPGPARDFPYVLGRLRTHLVHNLNGQKARDRETNQTCYKWFKEACGSSVPSGPLWEDCLGALLEQASVYLGTAIAVARAIENHPDSDRLCRLWIDRINRTEVVVEYHPELERAAGDLGYQDADLHRIVERNRANWTQAVSLASAAQELEDLRTRHLERSLLADTSQVLPVSARDVMERLKIPPGKPVADALRLAQALFAQRPDSGRDALLDWLAACWPDIRGARSTIVA